MSHIELRRDRTADTASVTIGTGTTVCSASPYVAGGGASWL